MTFKTSNPLPGDIRLVRISGFTGLAISAGQRIVGSGSYFTHAEIVVNDSQVVRAEPGGAVLAPLDSMTSGRVAYSDFALSDAQRAAIVESATALIGTPYSFADYLGIAVYRFTPWHALEDYISSDDQMICSQLCAEAYKRSGIVLFPNRPTGDVAPGDIARLIGAK